MKSTLKNRKTGEIKKEPQDQNENNKEENVEKKLSILQLRNLLTNENNKYVAQKLIKTTILMISVPIIVYFLFPILIAGKKKKFSFTNF
jgi:hypothetical protein